VAITVLDQVPANKMTNEMTKLSVEKNKEK
jgi:hypothetical protein